MNGVKIGIGLLVLGIIATVGSCGAFIVGVGEAFTAPTFATPGETTQTLEPGDHAVYERAEANVRRTGTGSSSSRTATLAEELSFTAENVTVTGPDGERIAVRPANASSNIGRNSDYYFEAIRFSVTTKGPHRVVVSGGRPTRAIVTETLGSQIGDAAPWIIGVVLGILAALVGLITAIVSKVRRKPAPSPYGPSSFGPGGAMAVPAWPSPQPGSWPQTQPNPAAPPTAPVQPAASCGPAPGWYPSGEPDGSLRWWDGHAWSDAQRPAGS